MRPFNVINIFYIANQLQTFKYIFKETEHKIIKVHIPKYAVLGYGGPPLTQKIRNDKTIKSPLDTLCI